MFALPYACKRPLNLSSLRALTRETIQQNRHRATDL